MPMLYFLNCSNTYIVKLPFLPSLQLLIMYNTVITNVDAFPPIKTIRCSTSNWLNKINLTNSDMIYLSDSEFNGKYKKMVEMRNTNLNKIIIIQRICKKFINMRRFNCETFIKWVYSPVNIGGKMNKKLIYNIIYK